MAKDIMYYFDKKTFKRYKLGEIQADFSVSFVIDGTKDSMQVELYNFNETEITPNTLLYHNATQTWWVVKRDIVKRYQHERDFYYSHNLTLNGAIDLLNNRDLTDCGFNDKTYTIDQFIKRLLSLSNFEYSYIINYGNNIDQNKVVDYVKTYENYTLLSALRDFLGGYNCDIKLSFETTTSENDIVIDNAIFTIIPKTGNVDLPILDIDIFDDIRETKTQNKESYGTTVISNAQNVISTQAKTYPQVDGVKLRSNSNVVDSTNAFLKLPSSIFRVNWLKIINPITIYIDVYAGGGTNTYDKAFFSYSLDGIEIEFDKWTKSIADNSGFDSENLNAYWELINRHKQEVIEIIQKAMTTTLYDGWKWDVVNQTFVAPTNNPDFYFPKVCRQYGNTVELTNANLVIGAKEEIETLTYTQRGVYYERGKDTIEGFKWLGDINATQFMQPNHHSTTILSYAFTDLRSSSYNNSTKFLQDEVVINPNKNVIVSYYFEPLPYSQLNMKLYDPFNTKFIVNYIPMSDLKIKLDNENETLDSQLYNQNGKLNDSVALSKLVNSYSKEIQNDTITRYMHYTNFADIPQVGQMVEINNQEKYVINNISYTFVPNETNNNDNVGYYIECEFTMSKYVSTKSLMVNPNSNIRDYGIPQKFNIKRRQVYRDYFEFDYSYDAYSNQDTPYVSLDNYLIMGSSSTQKNYDHTAIMKLTFDHNVDGNTEWYYQLNSTAYILKKGIYEIVDFSDNNIIGYDIQNSSSGFNMSRLFIKNWATRNTPISYTDENGNVQGIYLAMVNKNNLAELYNDIMVADNLSGNASFSSHCFVDSEFYNGKDTSISNESHSYSGSTSYYANNHSYIDIDIEDLQEHIIWDTFSVSITSAQWTKDASTYYFESPTTEIVIIDNKHYLRIWDYDADNFNYGADGWNWSVVLSFSYTYNSILGARERADYNLDEENYKKDAIEVPVFEYSMQVGDTKNIEVGEDILDDNNGIITLYTVVVKNRNTTSQLNASKFLTNINGICTYLSGDPYYSYMYRFVANPSVNLSLEDNNTKLRIRIIDSSTAFLYTNSDQTNLYYSGTTKVDIPIAKENFIGKDLLIYKSVVKSAKYDTNNNEFNYECDNKLMFIIHNPQESNFDGDDLLVNINYYRLK